RVPRAPRDCFSDSEARSRPPRGRSRDARAGITSLLRPRARPGCLFRSSMDGDLLLQHQRYLRRLVRNLVRDENAAEDLVQTTWLAALEQPPRSPDALRSWLARVARNLSFNRRRAEANEARRRERAAREGSWPPADEVAAELELAERV